MSKVEKKGDQEAGWKVVKKAGAMEHKMGDLSVVLLAAWMVVLMGS